MISKDDIIAAYERIKPFIRYTPTLTIEAGAFCDVPVSVKLEHLQFTSSFKARGAMNTVLVNDVHDAGVVAVSGGNHGAAVGYAASRIGHKAVVFAPDYASQVKIDRMRQYGVEVITAGNDFSVVVQKYETYARETGAMAIHPFDVDSVIAGQGTIGLEMEAQLPDLDTVLVAVGGGGQISGISKWYGDKVNVVAVESEGTATYADALQNGLGAGITPVGITADALGAPRLGTLPYTILTAQNRPSVVVSDADIKAAQRTLWDQTRMIGEPGGVTSLAALTSGLYKPEKDERIGIVICGGNAEPDWFLKD
jgi:threonine dehydratase